MMWHFSLLWSDWLFFGLLLFFILIAVTSMQKPHIRKAWKEVGKSSLGMISAVILICYLGVTALDCVHLRFEHRQPQVQSLLDIVLSPISTEQERSYSKPFATHLFAKSIVKKKGVEVRAYAPLSHVRGATGLFSDLSVGFLYSTLGLLGFFGLIFIFRLFIKNKTPSEIAWTSAGLTLTLFVLCSSVLWELSRHYHVLGTDKIGRDVLYLTLKSVLSKWLYVEN